MEVWACVCVCVFSMLESEVDDQAIPCCSPESHPGRSPLVNQLRKEGRVKSSAAEGARTEVCVWVCARVREREGESDRARTP